MVVLIVKKYDEIEEVIGPFEDSGDADDYFATRKINEPKFSSEQYTVTEPMIMRRWRS